MYAIPTSSLYTTTLNQTSNPERQIPAFLERQFRILEQHIPPPRGHHQIAAQSPTTGTSRLWAERIANSALSIPPYFLLFLPRWLTHVYRASRTVHIPTRSTLANILEKIYKIETFGAPHHLQQRRLGRGKGRYFANNIIIIIFVSVVGVRSSRRRRHLGDLVLIISRSVSLSCLQNPRTSLSLPARSR